MLQRSRTIRHFAFYETLGATADGSPAWLSISAGLLVLRLVDAHLEGDADAADLAAPRVLAAARAVDETDPSRSHLVGLAELLADRTRATLRTIAPPLFAYSRELDLGLHWRLAADVALCVASHAQPARDAEIAIEAMLRHGRLARMFAERDLSNESYATAGRIARDAGNLRGVLRAQLGEVSNLVERGNAPAAERLIDTVFRRARAAALTDVLGSAYEQRAHLAYLRRDHERAVRSSYEALQRMTDPANRALQLMNMASAFGMLGARTAARETMLLALSTTTDLHARWSMLINLMELASLDRNEAEFEGYRVELEAAPLPPLLRANFHLHLGQALVRAGRMADAQEELTASVRLAERHGFNRVLILAEQTLAAIARREPGVEAVVEAPAAAPASLGDVVDAVAALRRELESVAG